MRFVIFSHIQLQKVTVNQNDQSGIISNWVGYKHSRSPSGPFTLGKITHSDVLMSGGGLTATVSMPIQENGAVYVYYDAGGANLQHPKVICIHNGSAKFWYKAGSGPTNWETTTNFRGKTPETLKDGDLDGAGAGDITITQSNNYVIKLDKRPEGEGDSKKIKYRTKDTINITKDDNTSAANKVPLNYIRYDHKPTGESTNFTLSSVKHNDIPLKGINQESGVEAVYVYYRGNGGDNEHQFPLIVCVKTSSGQKYYKRGNTWTTIQGLTGDPETISGTEFQTLANKLDELKVLFEVKLEKTNPPDNYKGSPQPTGADITVSPLNENSGQPDFKGFKHSLPEAANKINRITIHGQIVNIPGLSNGGTITDKQFVFVYFPLKQDRLDLEKPLLICLSPTGGAGTGNKWYKRENKSAGGYTWNQDSTNFRDKDPEQINTFASELNGIKQKLTNPPDTQDTGHTPLDSVEIDISQTHGSDDTDTSYYFSGGKLIKVQKVDVKDAADNIPSTQWIGYKHSSGSGFTPNKIMHSDQTMTGLSDSLGQEIQPQGAIYVYYDNPTNITQPRVICISRNNSNHTWYKVDSANTNNWSKDSGTLSTKTPTTVTDNDLTDADAQEFTPQGGTAYIIKLDKRSGGVGPTRPIRYGIWAKNTQLTV